MKAWILDASPGEYRLDELSDPEPGPQDVRVRVRFSAKVARYVLEGGWHASQRFVRQRDGGLVAEFRLGAVEEVASWILGFGSEAVVLEPESLRAWIVGDSGGALVLESHGHTDEHGRTRTRHGPTRTKRFHGSNVRVRPCLVRVRPWGQRDFFRLAPRGGWG